MYDSVNCETKGCETDARGKSRKRTEKCTEGEITLTWVEGSVPSCFLIFKTGVDNAVCFILLKYITKIVEQWSKFSLISLTGHF